MFRKFSLLTAMMFSLPCLILMACANSAPSRFYVLSALTGPGEERERVEKKRPMAIGVIPVTLPAYLDRRQIVTRVSENELHLAGFDEWAEPLKDNFMSVLVENLSILLSEDSFKVFPFRNPAQIDYQVAVEVIRLDGRLGGHASLTVRWTLFKRLEREMLLTKKSSFHEPTGAPGYGSFVAAQSRAVEALSREIAGTIKGLARERGER